MAMNGGGLCERTPPLAVAVNGYRGHRFEKPGLGLSMPSIVLCGKTFEKKGEQTLFLQATSYLCNSSGAIFLLVLFSGRPVNAICNVSEAAEWYRLEELEICGRMGYVIIAANLNGRVCWRLKLNP